MNKLYAVMLGGLAKGSNIELHDIVFAVGPSLEDTYPTLVKKWFGFSHRLHIDNAVELNHVNGYDILISKQPPANRDKQLYCINFGGYKEKFFGELHEVGFYIAESENEAKQQGFNDLCIGSFKQHCDNKLLIESNLIDDLLVVNQVDNYYIHLEKSNLTKPLTFLDVHYTRLDVPPILAQAKSMQDE